MSPKQEKEETLPSKWIEKLFEREREEVEYILDSQVVRKGGGGEL